MAYVRDGNVSWTQAEFSHAVGGMGGSVCIDPAIHARVRFRSLHFLVPRTGSLWEQGPQRPAGPPTSVVDAITLQITLA
jgi:hypothetical protein